MKTFILIILCCFVLCSCQVSAESEEFGVEETKFTVSRIDFLGNKENEIVEEKNQDLKGIWVSQFDMHPIFRNGSKQREKGEFTELVEKMASNLKRDGFNTIFLQVRPNGDSMYESEVYPASKYIAGVYGNEIDYDAISIYLEVMKRQNISVHAWINPFRLCKEDELVSYGKGILFDWYQEGLGKRIEIGDNEILYLDPAYSEATELIVRGAKEILEKYNFDGIHLDDYFYPTEFEFNDDTEFNSSDFTNKGDFRRDNINRTVKAIYEATHSFGKIFGVAPAGNIYSLSDGWYVDIYKWCSEEGFVDYIMPQLYFGFNNKVCPFDKVLADWADAVSCTKIKLYIGLSAAKCELGTLGVEDEHAGEIGKLEWQENKDILSRSLLEIEKQEKADGVCIFTYSSFYDPITGDDNPNTIEEKYAFCQVMK